MKRFFIILLIIIEILIVGAVGYKYLELRQDVALSGIVPVGAMAKLESSDIYNALEAANHNNSINEAVFVKDIKVRLAALDSLLGKTNLESVIAKRPVSAVFYDIDKSNYDFLFFIQLKGGERSTFDELLVKASVAPNIMEKRKLQGIEICEIKKGNSQFSFVRFRNYAVISSSAVLIENFIRHVSPMQDWFTLPKALGQITEQPLKQGLQITLYYPNLQQLLSVCGDSSNTDFLKTFADSSELKLDLKNGHVHLNGTTSAGKNDFLYLFKGQKVKPLTIENYIPGNTAIFHYWSFEDGANFERTLENYFKKNNDQLNKWEKIKQDYLIDFKDYITEFDDELAYVKLEEKGELLLIKIVDPELMFLETNRLVTLFKKDKSSDSLYSGSYKNVRIRQMNYEKFPSLLLGNFFEGFTTSYYGIVGDYLVFASDLKQFKNLIDDIDAENVWGKTLKMRAYLEENCSASNYTYIINVPKAGVYLDSGSFKACPFTASVKSTEVTSIQYAWINDKIFTRFACKYNENKTASVTDSTNYTIEDIYALTSSIISKPYCYKSAGILSAIVQDSLLNLNLISKNNLQWTYSLASPLSELTLADLDRDGKNDIVFVTKDSVFAVTISKGENLTGFPAALPDKAIASQFSVIDYNKDKNFRILVGDNKGDVYMFDGKGRVLEGWKPNKMGKKLAAPVKHIRIGDKDILLAQLEDGTINAYNRRGELYENFPVGDKTQQCTSPLFIDEGVNFKKTTITTLSDKGELTVYNLNGELIKQEKLTGSPKDKFQLKTDRQNRSFIIIRTGKEKNVIFNSKLEQIYENNFKNKSLSVTYYNFGRGKEYIVLYKATDKESYLLNIKGEVLTSSIKSSSVPYLMYNSEDEELELINTENNILNKIIVESL